MRIVVDRDLCQGHGMCEEEAPDVFRVEDDGTLTVLMPEPPAEQQEAVREACRYCPCGALSVEESA